MAWQYFERDMLLFPTAQDTLELRNKAGTQRRDLRLKELQLVEIGGSNSADLSFDGAFFICSRKAFFDGAVLRRETVRQHLPARVDTTGLTAGQSTQGNRDVLDFADAGSELAVWTDVTPSWFDPSVGSPTVQAAIWWFAASTTGSVKWDVSIEAMPNTFDLAGGDSFDTVNTITESPPGTANQLKVTTLTLSNIDLLSFAENYRLKLQRDTTVGGNMTGDARVLAVVFDLS